MLRTAFSLFSTSCACSIMSAIFDLVEISFGTCFGRVRAEGSDSTCTSDNYTRHER
jgi:hypothetical protein